MSSCMHIYFGSYVELRPTKKEVVFTIRGCVYCKTVSIDKFCKTCGSGLKPYETTVSEDTSFWDFNDEVYRDTFFKTPNKNDYGNEVLLCNHTNDNSNISFDENDNEIYIETDNILISKMKDAFVEGYSDAVLKLEKFFGKENVNVKFGLISYYY